VKAHVSCRLELFKWFIGLYIKEIDITHAFHGHLSGTHTPLLSVLNLWFYEACQCKIVCFMELINIIINLTVKTILFQTWYRVFFLLIYLTLSLFIEYQKHIVLLLCIQFGYITKLHTWCICVSMH
jgi:hypothetical protein